MRPIEVAKELLAAEQLAELDQLWRAFEQSTDAVEDAEAAAQELEIELKRLPSQMDAASREALTGEVVGLLRRKSELEHELTAAWIGVINAKVRRAEARRAYHGRLATLLTPHARQTREEAEALQKRANQIGSAAQNARSAASVSHELGTLSRQKDQLLGDQATRFERVR